MNIFEAFEDFKLNDQQTLKLRGGVQVGCTTANGGGIVLAAETFEEIFDTINNYNSRNPDNRIVGCDME